MRRLRVLLLQIFVGLCGVESAAVCVMWTQVPGPVCVLLSVMLAHLRECVLEQKSVQLLCLVHAANGCCLLQPAEVMITLLNHSSMDTGHGRQSVMHAPPECCVAEHERRTMSLVLNVQSLP